MTDTYNCFFCSVEHDTESIGSGAMSWLEDDGHMTTNLICTRCMDKLKMRKGSL